MTINEIRRLNLEALISQYKTIRALAEKCDVNDAYLSQVRNSLGDSKRKTPRNLGDEIARKLEIGTGHPLGWMDTHHDAGPPRVEQTAPPDYIDPRRKRLMDAYSQLLDDQIEELLADAEKTAKRNQEIKAALSERSKAA